MGDVFQRIRRIFLSIITLGLVKYEDPARMGPYIVESMQRKLADLKASAVPVIANQYRVERMLEAELKKVRQLDEDSRQAVLQNEDDLAGTLLLQKEASDARVTELQAQLDAARQHADEAKQQIELFQEELLAATDRARSAQMRHQLATMRAQVQKFAMGGPSLDTDIRALERMEEQADQAYAESEAVGDIAAMGDQGKLRQVRQAARKQRADHALAELKAEMGLTDTEKRFKKVEVREGEEVRQPVETVSTETTAADQTQQVVTQSPPPES